MKIKRSNKKILPLFASVILILSIIIGIFAPATKADSPKIIVDDNDGDGAISVGDSFCLGTECFYVIDNSNGKIRALAKYNLYAGGDTYNVQNDPDYQYLNWDQTDFIQYSNGFLTCNWDWANNGEQSGYSATRCYKSYDTDIPMIDLSDRDDVASMGRYDLIELLEGSFGNIYDCIYRQNPNTGTSNAYVPYFCYDLRFHEVNTKQDPEMLSAHNDEQGKLIFPMRGNVYFSDTYYDGDNNIVLSEDYRQSYAGGYDDYNAWYTNSIISYYVYKYADSLKANYNISDIDLLSYNDLMHVLTAINPYDATFADDNYLIEDDETFNWEEAVYDEDDPHGYTYWFASMLDYIPEQYNWIYSSTYWLSTAWINNPYDLSQDNFGNEAFRYEFNYQFFVNTQGKLCSVGGYCGNMNIPAGIRPVITMNADDFQLNTYIDISGTVRWIDNSNSSNVRPDKSVIHLYRNGVEVDSVEVTKDDDEDLWRFAFADQPKYDENGNEYVYTVSQDDIPLYSSDITNFDIVNRYADSTIPNSPNTLDNIVLYSGIGIFLTGLVTVGYLAIRTRR